MEALAPRPNVLDVFAHMATPVVSAWLIKVGWEVKDQSALWAVVKDLGNITADAYRFAQKCEEKFKWPANTDLVTAMRGAYADALRQHKIDVQRWVVQSGVRFQQKPGVKIIFDDGNGKLLHGIIQTVLTETAEAVVVLVDNFADRTTKSQMVRITAEQVISLAAV